MESSKALEILRSITEACFGLAIIDDIPLMRQVNDPEWNQTLSRAIQRELGLTLSANEIESSATLLQLSNLLESRLAKDPAGRSLVDIYAAVERIAKEEYHPDIDYHWHARWNDFLNAGSWLTAPDELDAAEMVMRLEEEFGFGIPDQDAQALETVGQTTRYLWRRSCKQSFTLRCRSENICQSAFVFHELRRLLIIRGGVPRKAIHLEARLGELLPSWHAQFWRQVQDIFQVTLPEKGLMAFNRRAEKRTTIRELVNLISSSTH